MDLLAQIGISDWICPLLCAMLCVIHEIVDTIRGRKLTRTISRMCDICGQPVADGVEHSCDLNDTQLKALVSFVSSLKGGNHD